MRLVGLSLGILRIENIYAAKPRRHNDREKRKEKIKKWIGIRRRLSTKNTRPRRLKNRSDRSRRAPRMNTIFFSGSYLLDDTIRVSSECQTTCNCRRFSVCGLSARLEASEQANLQTRLPSPRARVVKCKILVFKGCDDWVAAGRRSRPRIDQIS